MKKPEVRKIVEGALKEVIKPLGFRFDRKLDGFVRAIAGGHQAVFVSLYDYRPLFKFSLTVGIHFQAVEQIIDTVFPPITGYEDLIPMTTLTQLGFFTDGLYDHYKAIKVDELTEATADMLNIARTKILPFLDKCQDICTVEPQLNAEKSKFVELAKYMLKRPFNYWTNYFDFDEFTRVPNFRDLSHPGTHPIHIPKFDSTQLPWRALHAVTLAHLNKNPNFDRIVRRLEQEMKDFPESEKLRLKQLVEFLKKTNF